MKRDDPQSGLIPYQSNSTQKMLEQKRRITEIKQKLAEAKEFTPEDSKQYFYRKIQEHPQNQLVITKLGWRIKDLHREEEDLALLCFNLLSSVGPFPLTVFYNDVKNGNGDCLKSLWMEVVILSPPDSIDHFSKQKGTMEMAILQVVDDHMLPLFQSFLDTQVCWKEMTKQEFNEKSLIETFQQKVIKPVRLITSNYLSKQPKN